MEVGKGVPDDVLQGRINDLAPNKCCTLIYTVSSFFDLVLSWQYTVCSSVQNTRCVVAAINTLLSNIKKNIY